MYNQCFRRRRDCNALNNFWRSLSNLTINVSGGSGCQSNTEFWAVSQAAPVRRVDINGGVSLMDYCSAGPQYASGGFIADSAFTGGTIVNGSQQQFFVRNSNLDGWTNGVWNQVFAGDIGAPAQNFGQASGDAYTTLPSSPVTEEEPFLQMNSSGSLERVRPGSSEELRPALRGRAAPHLARRFRSRTSSSPSRQLRSSRSTWRWRSART